MSSSPAKASSSCACRDYQVTSLRNYNTTLIQVFSIPDQEEKTWLRAIGLEDAKPFWEKTFDAKLTFSGLAVETFENIASFDEDKVTCLN